MEETDTARLHRAANELDSITRALSAKFVAVDADDVRRVVDDVYRDLAARARITAHLIPLTVHRARDLLAVRAAAMAAPGR